mgnify:CR=1 FL=1
MKFTSLHKVATSVLTASVLLTSGSILADSTSAQEAAGSNASFIQEWKQGIAGKKLVESSSDSSSGGTGYAGVAIVNSNHFCSNGQLIGITQSRVSGDVQGLHGSDGDTEQYTGQWRIVDADAQNAILEVTAENGGKRQVLLRIVNGGFYVNRTRQSVAQSELCQ